MISISSIIKKSVLKIGVFLVVVSLLSAGSFLFISQTWAYFNDVEVAENNKIIAGTLDFYLTSDNDFLTFLSASDAVEREIKIIRIGSLDFKYIIEIGNFSDIFCDDLNIQAFLAGDLKYEGSLKNFEIIPPIEISDGEDVWKFVITPSSPEIGDQLGKICNFDFNFGAWQLNLDSPPAGFTDEEIISNTVKTAECSSGHYITGHKFFDRNSNGVWDKDIEEGLEGWNIQLKKIFNDLYDYTKDGLLNDDDVTLLQSVADDDILNPCPSGKVCDIHLDGWIDNDDVSDLDVYINNLPIDLGNKQTDVDGYYSFNDFGPGDYTVKEIMQDGWSATTNQEVTLTLGCGENTINFGNYKYIPEPFCGDGNVDAGEECDDSNAEDGDGCSAECKIEIIETCMKINEVYYDPDDTHGDFKDEWIELYNACNHEVNLKNWYFKDNGSGEEKIHQKYLVGAGQFVVIAANASTWSYWPDIPDNAFKIALGGQKLSDGLNNDGDRVFLYDNNDNLIDTVSWGTERC